MVWLTREKFHKHSDSEMLCRTLLKLFFYPVPSFCGVLLQPCIFSELFYLHNSGGSNGKTKPDSKGGSLSLCTEKAPSREWPVMPQLCVLLGLRIWMRKEREVNPVGYSGDYLLTVFY